MDNLRFSFVNEHLHSSVTEILLVFLVSLLSGVYVYSYLKNRNKNYPPGPVGIPVLGYLPFLGAEPHKTLWKLKEEYGDVIGLYLGSKYTVVLNDWTAVKEILTHSSALNRAPNLFDHIPRAGFITANGKEWLEQRRFCLSASRDLGVGRGPWETIIMEEVQNFIEEIQKSNGKPIEISHQLSSSISSNIVSFLIGRRLRKEEEPEKVQLSVDFSDVSFTYMGPSNATTVMPWLRKYFELFKIAGYDRASKIINGFCQFVKDEISRHKTSSEFRDVNDFINTYLGKLSELTSTSNKTQHYFSENMLVGNVNILFLAASDTIFSSLGWIFRLMAQHPHIQQKVYNELVTVLGKDGVALYEERHKIPYTFAVMMESQRFSSIVPLSTTRWFVCDTIFSSLGWIFRLMAQHPHIQQKVYNELVTVLGKDGVALYEERHKIPYTFAIMMESQRFSSIVPLSTARWFVCDTIFSSLGWIFRLMAHHPHIQQKVYNEIVTVLGKDGVALYEERHKIPYTFAVMMESQRFSSIVPLSTTRGANSDFSVRGYTIPKGAEIVANLWALHNDSKYWDEPEQFKPERFLDATNVLLKSPPSYAPFSIGRRNCPGETIAWMEILSYFSEIIKKFEITTEKGQKPKFDIVNGLVAHLEPQPLCFKERVQ